MSLRASVSKMLRKVSCFRRHWTVSLSSSASVTARMKSLGPLLSSAVGVWLMAVIAYRHRYLRIDSRAYQLSKLASAILKSITSTENAEMHAGTVHSTDGNEQLHLLRTFFFPAEYYREVRVPPLILLWWQRWHPFLEFWCGVGTAQASLQCAFSLGTT